jgi:CubicO group peptidase (beta-lactamase class C family)
VAVDEETPLPGRMVAGYANAAGVTWLRGSADQEDCPAAETVVCVSAAGTWIVAACVAILVRQGDLEPNLPVRTLLPELPAWAAPIRLHHLIHHTSGLPEAAALANGPGGEGGDWTNETVLGLLAAVTEPRAEPGTVFSYNDIGYACLTALAERAGGRPVAEIAQKHLFAPLGMTSTQFWAGPPSHPPAAVVRAARGPDPARPRIGDGLWSTARDMLRWAEAMHAGALGPRLTALLRQPGRLRDGAAVPYAWGSFILPGEGGPAFAHQGRLDGCVTYVVASPATATSAVVVAFTDDPQPAEALGRQLAGLSAAVP